MDLFDEKVLSGLHKEEEKHKGFTTRSQKLHLISMSDESTMMETLLNVKGLFQKMLPKMPKKYIIRQVYDQKHSNLVLVDGNQEIIGAICYRPAFEKKLVEIVFFAINFEYHSQGYGSFLFNCFKEVVKKQYVRFLESGSSYLNKNIEIDDLKELGFSSVGDKEENNDFEDKGENNKNEENKGSLNFKGVNKSNIAAKEFSNGNGSKSNIAVNELSNVLVNKSNNNNSEGGEEIVDNYSYSKETNKLNAERGEEIVENVLAKETSNETNKFSKFKLDNDNEISNLTLDNSNNNKKIVNKWGNEELYDEMTNLYLLTYADNSAIGFFKKQGFVTRPVSSLWVGFIKDYDGGTLMECKLVKKLKYLMKKELVERLRENIFENMKKINEYHIVRRWDERDKINEIRKKDYDDKINKKDYDDKIIDQNNQFNDQINDQFNNQFNNQNNNQNNIQNNNQFNNQDNNQFNNQNYDKINDKINDRNQGFEVLNECSKISTVVTDLNFTRTSKEFLYDFIFFCICTLHSDSFAWPFLEPVNTKDVPDYLDVITEPIDLSLIADRHNKGKYTTLKEFVNDVNLMVKNCLTYNNIETQYYKCGEKIRETLNLVLNKYNKIIELWKLDFKNTNL